MDRCGSGLLAGLKKLAARKEPAVSSFTATGAFQRAMLRYVDYDNREYEKIPVDEQCEVVSLIGNIAPTKEEPSLLVHALLDVRGGRAIAGHVLEATVRPTLEIMLIETPAHFVRCKDAERGWACFLPMWAVRERNPASGRADAPS